MITLFRRPEVRPCDFHAGPVMGSKVPVAGVADLGIVDPGVFDGDGSPGWIDPFGFGFARRRPTARPGPGTEQTPHERPGDLIENEGDRDVEKEPGHLPGHAVLRVRSIRSVHQVRRGDSIDQLDVLKPGVSLITSALPIVTIGGGGAV
jgi:hypothetical protein